MNLKPWREIIAPHPDVLSGTFQQSEFAADLTAVRTGKATVEYGDARAFFERTFITEGLGRLLMQVAQRLNGKSGEPIIQLQTAFGGGKTHTLLAVYHLVSRKCPLGDLVGIPALLDQASLLDVPLAQIAVLDGTAHSPGQPWKHGKQPIRTLWGELAWQLGKTEGLTLVQQADATGTSPGKDVLVTLLERYAPCVVLLDELVVYVRQFVDSQPLSGGTYDSNLSFIQSLTEAAKLVPRAAVLASLPESDSQAGGPRGQAALRALEAVFNRVQALWKTVSPEEAFEIVRRRLFERMIDTKSRDQVCRAFADAYVTEGSKLPQDTQNARYYDRMVQSYPIHPEVFAQLYSEWTTIQDFQRTRGVLKLMAKVIYRLWQDNNNDLMILPGSLPLYDGSARSELIYYLGPGWDAVMDRDVDGDKAETTLLETRETRFGAVQAARRVARTVFLSSAPSSVNALPGIRGIDRGHVLLGCLQPGQTCSLYSDALNRLADQLHYLNASGDKSQDSTRFWFDTRANLRREMEERKKRYDDAHEVRGRMGEVVKRTLAGASFFDGIHIFTPHSDVPDDGALRLVVLAPEHFHSRDESRVAFESVLEHVRTNGTKPRYRGNRLIFVAADHGVLARLRDCIRVALAWSSIVDDVAANRLVLDNLQADQAKKELKNAEDVLPRVARECFKWLLCASQDNATDKPHVESFPLNTSSAALGPEIERVCIDNELVIATWSPIHLRTKLNEIYWKADRPVVKAAAFWEDTMRYLYLPRLRDRGVLSQAIVKGAATRDFFGTAYGEHEELYDGFKLGDANVQFDDTLLLIEPSYAASYAAALQSTANYERIGMPGATGGVGPEVSSLLEPKRSIPQPAGISGTPKAKSFHGSVSVNAAAAKMRLVQIADEVIAILAQDPMAAVTLTVEVHATFSNGAAEQTKRAVAENAKQLGFGTAEWE